MGNFNDYAFGCLRYPDVSRFSSFTTNILVLLMVQIRAIPKEVFVVLLIINIAVFFSSYHLPGS